MLEKTRGDLKKQKKKENFQGGVMQLNDQNKTTDLM